MGFEGVLGIWGFRVFLGLGGYLGMGIGGEKEGDGFEEGGVEVVGREEKGLWFGSEAKIAIDIGVEKKEWLCWLFVMIFVWPFYFYNC